MCPRCLCQSKPSSSLCWEPPPHPLPPWRRMPPAPDTSSDPPPASPGRQRAPAACTIPFGRSPRTATVRGSALHPLPSKACAMARALRHGHACAALPKPLETRTGRAHPFALLAFMVHRARLKWAPAAHTRRRRHCLACARKRPLPSAPRPQGAAGAARSLVRFCLQLMHGMPRHLCYGLQRTSLDQRLQAMPASSRHPPPTLLARIYRSSVFRPSAGTAPRRRHRAAGPPAVHTCRSPRRSGTDRPACAHRAAHWQRFAAAGVRRAT
ncbi:MAG: hypothetical protein J3K34DRAFT_33544 [Monoraphidium minutum]|nr:MAG: hypothetical protein J3K34DRAFT_33544 [Monoraphidium minutum]